MIRGLTLGRTTQYIEALEEQANNIRMIMNQAVESDHSSDFFLAERVAESMESLLEQLKPSTFVRIARQAS